MTKNSNWQFLTFSQSHAGKVRPYNEDACLDCVEAGVWVVADGMGGHKAGDVASRMLVEIVRRDIDAISHDLLCIDDLRRALSEANRKIYEYSKHDLNGETIGTTVVLLFIKNGFFHCLWVGDSRLYLYRHNQLTQQSRDHSQVMDMVDQGLIRADEAENHPLANVITRAIGVSSEVDIDQITGELVFGDQFLLCSDGLTKELPDNHIANCLQANSVTDSGLALMHSALVRGASDNVTCVLIRGAKNSKGNNEWPDNDDTVPVFYHSRR